MSLNHTHIVLPNYLGQAVNSMMSLKDSRINYPTDLSLLKAASLVCNTKILIILKLKVYIRIGIKHMNKQRTKGKSTFQDIIISIS